MKRIFYFIMVVFAFTACKTSKQQPQSQYTTDPTAQPKVFAVPGTETTVATNPAAVKPDENPISTKKEQVTFTQPEDRTGNESNTFFVIIGSFSQLDNAKNYRETLLDEGFTPIILHSETGYYRVCVNSYKNENEARVRIRELRQAFPKYSDVWLLLKE